jgi:hypothetical protein
MNRSGNALTMRAVNINLVRNSLKARKQATKQQIAEATGLRIVTVATIMQELVEANDIFAVDQAPSSGGRPAVLEPAVPRAPRPPAPRGSPGASAASPPQGWCLRLP